MQDAAIQRAENIIALPTPKERPLTILAVEDDRLERAFLGEHIESLGHEMMQAAHGQQALDILEKNRDGIDVILMDRMMPVMDGLTAVKRIKAKAEFRRIPIIMVTAATSSRDIQEGLDAGVFYYLTKPVDEAILRSVLTAATREAQQNRALNLELKRHRSSFSLIHTCKFQFRTLEDASALAAFCAHCFPEPERVLPGLGELMINSIEHGNLAVGYHRKTSLLESGLWQEEIRRRLNLDLYKKRTAEAVITRREGNTYIVITDQGDGFDWQRYLTIDPSRAGDNHGRGIAQARILSFDQITYNEKGNQVIAVVDGSPKLEW